MSEKRKHQRAMREEKERKKAEAVVKWIIGILIALAVVYAFYSAGLMKG